MQQLILKIGNAIYRVTAPYWVLTLSNGVADTLESSTILIYLETHKGLHIQNEARCPTY